MNELNAKRRLAKHHNDLSSLRQLLHQQQDHSFTANEYEGMYISFATMGYCLM